MNVAVLFEQSGLVRDAFRALGHNATSFDLEPSRTGGPHIQGDLTKLDTEFSSFDLIIAHPPCTALCVSGNRYYAKTSARAEAAELISWVWNLPVAKLAIENPVGQINAYVPDMPAPYYIQPYEFGHPESKKTGLWTRNLPRLKPTHVLPLPATGHWENQTPTGQNRLGPSPERAYLRSRTYPGIAQAMATQWSTPT